MSDQPKGSGQDLARQALAAYRATAKTKPATKAPARRRRVDRAGGRDPVGFGAVLGQLNAEQGWGIGLSGGSVLADWATLCPELVGKVAPEGYDPERGELRLRPASYAYGTHLSMLRRQLVARINEKLGKTVVRSIRILPVGAIDTAAPTSEPESLESLKTDLGPVRTRESASPGYRHNLALHQAHKPETPTESPLIAAARADLDARIADPSRREPETAFTDGMAALEHATTTAGPQDDAEAVRQAAIRMARAQKAGTAAPVRRAFEVAS